MNTTSGGSFGTSGKRNRNKLASGSEDEGHVIKKMKPDCCTLSDLNRSRIYNFGYRKKPAELFRKDLISAMKMPDSEQLNREDYLLITDSWREEWEKGVQVPVYPDNLPTANVRVLREPKQDANFKMPKKLIKHDSEHNQSNYELDLLDLSWLEMINESETTPSITESQMEDVINELEHQCARNMKEKQIGIEYDDHIICDVCRSPDAEEGNEMVFCDLCNICVHQACYGITEIPDGEWLCRPCKEFGTLKTVSCVLCPNLGGALKPTSTSNQWAHVSCALWVPEVSIGCVSTMEPITKVKQIPQMRWNLVCSLCNVKQGAPIQCSVKTCKIAYHVTCAFNHKLKMKAIVDNDGGKGVKLKSYCKKHTEKEESDEDVKSEQKEKESGTQNQHQHEIEIATFEPDKSSEDNLNEFWKYIDINKIQNEIQKKAQKTNQPQTQQTKIHQYIDFILQYWKLKRTSNYGASLIKLTSSAHFEEQQLQQRNDILRLRVDLERIRNLSYMICRREKIKRNWVKTHQSTIESTLSLFGPGNSNFESKTVHVSEDTSKLVRDIVNNSVIYNYDKELDKTVSSNIVRTLKRLSKIERINKHKPNPYAKFYITGLKRKDKGQCQNESNCSPSINGVSSSNINHIISKAGSNNNNNNNNNSKPLNGLTPSQTSSSPLSFKQSPVNGIHAKSSNNIVNDPRISLSENKKSIMKYRQSPRSLLKPKSPTQNSNSSSPHEKNQDKSISSPIPSRSSLIGYKIPKKKNQQQSQPQQHQQNVQPEINKTVVKEINESIQNFKRRLDPHFCTNIRPSSPNKISTSNSPTKNSSYCSEKNVGYYHNHIRPIHGKFHSRKNHQERFYKNKKPQSILSHVTTRAQGNAFDEAALLASAVNDIDMRRQPINFRPPLIH